MHPYLLARWLIARTLTLAFFTQKLCIMSTAEVRQFSVFVCSQRTKQLWRKAAPVFHFIQQASTADPKQA